METQSPPLLLVIAILSLFFLIIYLRVKRARFWTEKGIRAHARVIKAINSGMKGYNSTSFSFGGSSAQFSSRGVIWDLYLDIEQQGLPRRRLNIYHRFKDGLDDPQPGDLLPILIHPQKPDKIVFLPRDFEKC